MQDDKDLNNNIGNFNNNDSPSVSNDASSGVDVNEEIIIESADGELEENEENAVLKIKKIKEKLKECCQKKNEYLLGWQRAKADFVNYKKEIEKEKENIVKFSKMSLIVELLEVVNGFNMAFSNKESWEKLDLNWRMGVEHIYANLMDILKNNGLEEIQVVDGKFNAMEHQSVGVEAVTRKEEDGLIIKVFQRGYKLHGRVVRPAKVIVGNYEIIN